MTHWHKLTIAVLFLTNCSSENKTFIAGSGGSHSGGSHSGGSIATGGSSSPTGGQIGSGSSTGTGGSGGAPGTGSGGISAAGGTDLVASGGTLGTGGGASSGGVSGLGGTGAGGKSATGGASGGGATGTGGDSSVVCSGSGEQVPAAERASNGGPVLPPKWAFGVLWGSYYDQIGSQWAQVYAKSDDKGNILTAAERLRADYSGDLMWIDSSWLSHNYNNDGPAYVCFKFDADAFPDPAAMIAKLREQHFHFGVWEWPWMGHGCQYFQTGVDNKHFIMNGATPAATSGAWHGDTSPAAFDYTNTAASNWWVGLNKQLTDWGLDFMKLDTDATQLNSVVNNGGKLATPSKSLALEYHHAAYIVTQTYAAANDARAKMNGARGFIMPKTPAAASDQYPGWWTDDTATTWTGMATEIGRASQLNTSSTAAYWAGDTGGYFGKPTDELFIRWLQYSTFTPLQEYFGSKAESGSVGARFPWLFGAQAQAAIKQYTQLRYRLLPFRYSNGLVAYLVKPTVYPVRWNGTRQLVLGQGDSQMLVQPVTSAGVTSMSVTLPEGTWIHYWTGKSYTGTATVPVPIDQAPIFVKAGSIIPMGPKLRWVDEVPPDPLTLDIYPSGSTGYTLYEDDGASEGYMGGAYATTAFKADDSGGKVVVSIEAQKTAKYRFAGQICNRRYILSIHGRTAAPAQVTRDGTTVPAASATTFDSVAQGWYYDSTAGIVWVKFPLASTAATSVSL
jgi:alpha-glucosidase (family GH31 glycosyl hydrolase)